mmetsp:Transcript_19376/g.34881  ORF Transcript_19376/g.34881 Transcript_19376/m.34881 type:complete len:266 (+) Transcript_19376:281-1078(+)
MHTTTKRNPRVRLVFFFGFFSEAIWIKIFWIFPQLRQAMSCSRTNIHDVSLRDGISLEFGIDLDGSAQLEKWWMQSERLAQHLIKDFQALHFLISHCGWIQTIPLLLFLLAKNFILFIHDLFQPFLVLQQMSHQPSRCHIRGMLPSQQNSNEHTCNFIDRERGSVAIFGFHENLQKIVRRFIILRVHFFFFVSRVNNFLKHLLKQLAGCHALVLVWVGQVWEEEQNGNKGMIQSQVVFCHARAFPLLTDLWTQQTATASKSVQIR